MTIRIETDCTFTVEGKDCTAGGAVITPDFCRAYLGRAGVLTDWHGNPIGTYRIVSTWRTPRSFVSDTMSQVVATVDGVAYTGRSAGIGMVFSGRRAAKQPNAAAPKAR